jgi:GntR family transcriptional regulator, transcriptional repressor for pyruvate dehydrogenase complex
MIDTLTPISRQSLADNLAERIRHLIQAEGYEPGDRLPTIADMSRRFGVGHPTLREALKKLETLGMVSIRHGSGVYVGRNNNSLLISNPVYSGTPSRKLLLDLIEARIPIEVTSARLAALNATPDHLRHMRSLLSTASEHLDDDAELSRLNMNFHREIAEASGNPVLAQLLEVLTNVFQDEQRAILDIYGSRRKDHHEHVGILEALAAGDAGLAVERMSAHLEGVREALLRGSRDQSRPERHER